MQDSKKRNIQEHYKFGKEEKNSSERKNLGLGGKDGIHTLF
jgi:hypothetical protein